MDAIAAVENSRRRKLPLASLLKFERISKSFRWKMMNV